MHREDLTYAACEAQVDLGRIRSNLRAMTAMAAPADVIAVVKANAYGHGAVEVTRSLREEGVRYFAVAQLPEALELRRAGILDRIIVFGVPKARDLDVFVQHRLDLVIGSEGMVRHVAGQPGFEHLNVHVKVDTGMHRLGISPPEAAAAIAALRDTPGVHLAGLWTHLSSSDEPSHASTHDQMARFEPVLRTYQTSFDFVHVSASSGLWNFRHLLKDSTRAFVRLGISLYGYLEDSETSQRAGLLPALRLVSRVVRLHTVPAGDGVSYNLTWTAPEDTRIATVAAGYADGYPRNLSNRSRVGIGGNDYPSVGTVCMDMFMVNLGPARRPSSISEGDEVVLFGDGGPSAFEVADWAETIVYEVCTNISARVNRTFL